MTTTVVLAHGTAIVRQGLRRLLEESDGISIVAEAGNGAQAVEAIARHQPQLALLDADLPRINGFDAARRVKRRKLGAKVVLLSVTPQADSLTRSLQAGVQGFVGRDFTIEELVRAIGVVSAGQIYLSPTLSSAGAGRTRSRSSLRPVSPELLTVRQREVLRLLADGRSTRQIGAELSISPKTVDTHRKDLMARLGLFSIAELTKYAVREGVTGLE